MPTLPIRVLLTLSLVAWVGFWVASIADASKSLQVLLFIAGAPGQIAIIWDGIAARKAKGSR